VPNGPDAIPTLLPAIFTSLKYAFKGAICLKISILGRLAKGRKDIGKTQNKLNKGVIICTFVALNSVLL
jgi:hypothetical protein